AEKLITEKNFVLIEEKEDIEAITVQAKAINYADEVIKNAQAKRKLYLEQSSDYQCVVYIKGLAELTKKPKQIMGQTVTGVDTGIVYLSESISEVSYRRKPKAYQEKMIASKVSGDSKGFSFNQVAGWSFNFYENLTGKGLSARGFVSPIANVAFLYYNYKWEGQIREDSLIINKIKVIPKRKTDPVWEGYIYITEGDWRIHSVDLSFDKNRPVDFVNSGSIKQVFTQEINQKDWLLLSQTFHFGFYLFGFEGKGDFTKVYTTYETNPKFSEKHFGKDLVIVEKESNQKDTNFWQKNRPIPLLNSEKLDYIKKDSLELIKNSQSYKDSLDKINNKFKINNLLFGYTYQNSFKKYALSFSSPLNEITFNTVEGWAANLRISYQKELKERKKIEITPTFRYGFSSQTFYSSLKISYLANPKYFRRWTLEGGKYIEQFQTGSIEPFINTFTSLYQKLNFMKLYEKVFTKLSFNSELFAGFSLNSHLEYAYRNTLQNTTDFTWSKNEQRFYTSNTPLNSEISDIYFNDNQVIIADINLTFTPKQRYINRPDIRLKVASKYPSFYLSYKKGFGQVNFDHLELGLSDNYRWGLLGQGSYRLFAGDFLNAEQLTFADYKHFNGNRVALAFPIYRPYQLLDYYVFSTTKKYAGAYYEHHFDGFFLNGIPLLKKTRMQEVFSCNYLWSETNGNYVELGFGLEHIFKFLRVDYFWAFSEGKTYHNALRFGLGF
ncbi:MAG: DUF5686 family protein, partial [Thermonemataceae bacterium]|nr:DUF5686 family protein [Thermonemataceae bacterium]